MYQVCYQLCYNYSIQVLLSIIHNNDQYNVLLIYYLVRLQIVIDTPVSRAMYEGTSVNVTCPNITDVKWTRNNQSILRNHFISRNSLIMFDLLTEDSGIYECTGRTMSPNKGVEVQQQHEILVGGKYENTI